ncbi:hypothetical protein CHS0354_020327 [Potamilus streckersoni]|uniref:Uncharacterized protein n=1 Tax=Potamilus streckersoni TaxID=2493646 RepID=A0AAE0SFY8_9BIVA|nr:hypothetical protein CHS0354_020327 [Potamilus streckersoni]
MTSLQHIPMALICTLIFILPGVSTVACKNDQYFDPHTGNCDPCATLCAVTNCSRLCPNYQIPQESSIRQIAGSIKSSSFIKEHFSIVLAVKTCAVIFSALFGFIFYQRHQNGRWCKVNRQIPVTTDVVQPTELDIESIPMNENSDEALDVL